MYHFFFIIGKFGVHYIWYQSNGYTTWTSKQGIFFYLVHAIMFNENLKKLIIVTNKKIVFFCDNGSTE
jgi:hypothetical protein